MPDGLHVTRGGDGDPVLLLLHGLGATAYVWRPMVALLEEGWPGRWVAPDLPGHGGSAPLPRYSFGAPDLQGLLAAAHGPAVLARGEHDQLVTTEQLARLVDGSQTLSGAGHNAHVEDPARVAQLLSRCRASWTAA